MVQVQPLRYRLAIVLNTLFYPLTFPDIIESLKQRGFVLPEGIEPSVPLGPRAYVGGQIASKNDTIVDLNPDRKIVAVEGRTLENVLGSFDEMTDILSDDFKVDVSASTDYVEITAVLIVKSEGLVREHIARAFEETEILRGMKAILDFEPAIRSFSITAKGKPPEGRDYAEITIAPRITAEDTYYVQVIYRNPQLPTTLSFAKSINSKGEALIGQIEGTQASARKRR